MIIGIDGSRAFLSERTGIEEYSYQVIKYLRSELVSDYVVLYVKKNFEFRISNFESKPNIQNSELKIESKFRIKNLKFGFQLQEVDFDIPENWTIKGLWAPRLWTQFRLSLEMLFHPVDTLFIPAHTVPIIHPRKTIVTVHGLEYEFCPQAYSFLERWYMRLSIQYSVRVVSTVIAVSENTRKDLISIYHVPEKKIQVVYEGYENLYQVSRIMYHVSDTQYKIPDTKYILFIGRLEERKNVVRIIEAFEILKEKYRIPHQLVLAGKPGYGYENIEYRISNIECRDEIMELGYVSEEEKWELLRNADVFVFPSLYEGFGIPILEAQSVGTPIVTSNTSSLPEVAGEGAVFVDPLSVESIAEGVLGVLSDAKLRDGIIDIGKRNVERFSWKRCAEEIAECFK